MKKIKIANGKLILEKEWVYFEFEPLSESSHIYAIEIRNGKKYEIPVLIFCSNLSLNKLNKEKLYLKIIESYPQFKKVIREQINADFDNPHVFRDIAGLPSSAAEFLAAPQIGIFELERDEHGCN